MVFKNAKYVDKNRFLREIRQRDQVFAVGMVFTEITCFFVVN